MLYQLFTVGQTFPWDSQSESGIGLSIEHLYIITQIIVDYSTQKMSIRGENGHAERVSGINYRSFFILRNCRLEYRPFCFRYVEINL